MTCSEYVERVSDYVDEELTQPERAACDEHAAGCPGCRRYVEQVRVTVRLMGALARS